MFVCNSEAPLNSLLIVFWYGISWGSTWKLLSLSITVMRCERGWRPSWRTRITWVVGQLSIEHGVAAIAYFGLYGAFAEYLSIHARTLPTAENRESNNAHPSAVQWYCARVACDKISPARKLAIAGSRSPLCVAPSHQMLGDHKSIYCEVAAYFSTCAYLSSTGRIGLCLRTYTGTFIYVCWLAMLVCGVVRCASALRSPWNRQ